MNKPKVTKAVIAAAGFGTRFLPATKNIPKEMLPIVNVPTIHLVVKECIVSGITDIIIVTRQGNTAIEDYFDLDPTLELFLKQNNKQDRIKDFYEIFGKANIAFVRQNKKLPYGNGSPLLAAKPFLNPSEAFIYLYADDVTYAQPPVIRQLVKRYEQEADADAVLGVQKVAKQEISKYASIMLKDPSQGDGLILDIIEKPSADKAPSLLASFGRYLLPYEIFNYLNIDTLGKDNELWTADAIRRMAKDYNVYAHAITGVWMTAGDPINMLKTNLFFYLNHPEYKDKAKKIIKDALSL